MRSILVVVSLSVGAIAMACSGSSDGSAIADPTSADAGEATSSSGSSGVESTSSSGGSSSGKSSTSSSGSSSGSTTKDAGKDAAEAGGGTCNKLTQLGSKFDLFTTQSDPPEPLGGTIPNGLYVATSGKVWGSNAAEGSKFGTAGSVTMEISGNTVQTITTGASSGVVTRRSGTFATNANDNTATFTVTCVYPAQDAGGGTLQDGPYTVDGTTLHFWVALSSTLSLELVYTKQ